MTRPAANDTLERPTRVPARASALLLASLVTVAAMFSPVAHPAVVLLVMAGTILLPGVSTVVLLGGRRLTPVVYLGAATGCGLIVTMLLGWLSSVLLPVLGIDRPLDALPQKILYTVVLGALIVVERRRDDAFLETLLERLDLRSVVPGLVFCVLPLSAIVGAQRLNNGEGATVALATLTCAFVLLLGALWLSFTGGGAARSTTIRWVLYHVAVAVMLGTSLRGDHLFGWDIQKEFSVADATLADGAWTRGGGGDAYQAMLSITAMPVQMHSLTGIALTTVMRVLYPLVFALVPVLLHHVAQKRSSLRAATFTVAGLIFAAGAFAQPMATITRQQTALVLFTAAFAVMLDETLTARPRRALVGVLLGGIAFSHYTTAYIVTIMVVLAYGAGRLVTTRKSSERARDRITITGRVAAGILAAALSWNLLLAPTGSIFEAPRERVGGQQVTILPTEDERTLVETWLQASAKQRVTPDLYAQNVEANRENFLWWMNTDERLATITVEGSTAPTVSGPLGALNGQWHTGHTFATQLVLALTFLSLVLALSAVHRRRGRLPADYVGLALGAISLGMTLRLVGWMSEFYNGERASLHIAMVASVSVAVLVERLLHQMRNIRIVRIAALCFVAVLAANPWSLAPHVFSGSVSASTTATGENVERFVISSSELAGARWIGDTLEDGDLVQTDRYGAVRLLNVAATAKFNELSILHPQFIDESAYLYVTRANVVAGRARGAYRNLLTVYTSPVPEIEKVRPTLYSNDDTRMYGQ